MSNIVGLLKSKFFLLGAILVIVCGAILLALSGGESMFAISGGVFILIGFLLLISGYITPIVSESMQGTAIGLFLFLGALLGIVGMALMFTDENIAYPLLIGSMVVTALSCLSWPCICCQGSKGIKSQVIGIASAHDRITITELSSRTGASVKLASEIVYDAIGKGTLSGRMEGDTFVRSAPSTTSYATPSTHTREREVVKVLVICPYCGAKTEQGLSKCQNCQADL